ncbi:hypothetical protein IE53DRAFT_109052 [Violaceomyces palustris]|uniref:Uncharacterized protein n=1 Tax=Violaceomyces palustris TaxID=1673888 RepID=A0ACD0NWF5_9BASI|nr:hypothetical protein IE53DRAFT_109052 [Violaceomyces palustris]
MRGLIGSSLFLLFLLACRSVVGMDYRSRLEAFDRMLMEEEGYWGEHDLSEGDGEILSSFKAILSGTDRDGIDGSSSSGGGELQVGSSSGSSSLFVPNPRLGVLLDKQYVSKDAERKRKRVDVVEKIFPGCTASQANAAFICRRLRMSLDLRRHVNLEDVLGAFLSRPEQEQKLFKQSVERLIVTLNKQPE